MSTSFVLRFLTAFAILFAAIGMSGGHAAMAMPVDATTHLQHLQAAEAAAHCADMAAPAMGEEQHHFGSALDCMIACTGLPARAATFDAAIAVTAPRLPLPILGRIDGVLSRLDPPPPRAL